MASIDNHAITLSDVEREYGFELFLEGQAPRRVPDGKILREVRDRLIDQELLEEESAAENPLPATPSKNAAEELSVVRKKFSSEEAYQSALRSLRELGMDEQEILARLSEHDRILAMIDRRLRPAAWVEASEVEEYYQKTFLPEYARRNPSPAPALAKVESQIREILTQRKMDPLLTAWLAELSSGHQVGIHSF